MTRSEIKAWVKIHLAEQTSTPIDDIDELTNLYYDLGMDSLDQVEAILEVEKHFDISIPDTDAEEIMTVRQLIDQIEKLIPQK